MLRISLKTCMIILLAKQDSTYDECRDNDRIFGFLKIKSDIITGALKPGKKSKLDALKVQYSSNFSTLRETLNRLASDGFVEVARATLIFGPYNV